VNNYVIKPFTQEDLSLKVSKRCKESGMMLPAALS